MPLSLDKWSVTVELTADARGVYTIGKREITGVYLYDKQLTITAPTITVNTHLNSGEAPGHYIRRGAAFYCGDKLYAHSETVSYETSAT